MQILPFTTQNHDASQAAGHDSDGKGSSLFGDLFAHLAQAAQDPSSVAAAAKEGQSGSPNLRQGKAAAQTSLKGIAVQRDKEATQADLSDKASAAWGGVTKVPMERLEVTREDFDSIKQALKDFGLSNQDIEELQNQVAKGGMAWSAFIHQLSQKTGLAQEDILPTLDTDQQRLLNGFFQKLGFLPEQAGALVADIKQGNLSKVWGKVSEKLSAMDADQLMSVNANELKALAKALNLPQETGARLADMFASLGRDRMTRDELAQALALVKNQVKDAQERFNLKGAQLRQALQDAVDDAVARFKTKAEADQRESREVQQVKELIQDKVEREGRRSLRHAEEQAAEAARARNGRRADMAGERVTQHEQGRFAKAHKPDAVSEDQAQQARRGFPAQESGGKDAKADYSWDNKNDSAHGRKDQDQGWSDLLKRIEVKVDRTLAGAADTVAAHVEAEGKEASVPAAGREKLSSARVFQQVEQGLLKNLGQGRKELTLRLDPPDLGKVQLVLQVRDKEVQAVLKVDSEEAGKALAEQLARLRTSLEQQGLKVQKLEIQTQLQQQQNQTTDFWQGTQQHNLAQEWGAFARRQANLRMLNAQGESLAQEMQSIPKRANISSEGIYIIA